MCQWCSKQSKLEGLQDQRCRPFLWTVHFQVIIIDNIELDNEKIDVHKVNVSPRSLDAGICKYLYTRTVKNDGKMYTV